MVINHNLKENKWYYIINYLFMFIYDKKKKSWKILKMDK